MYANSLRDSGLYKQADQVAQCQTQFWAFKCSNGHRYAYACRCDVRGCPHCDRRRGRETAQVFETYFRAMKRPRFMTLTIESSGRLEEGLTRLRESFTRFKRRKAFKAHVVGGFYSIEVTYGEAGWHPHLHIVFDGFYWDQAELSAEWSAAGGGPIVDIREADLGSVKELTKYLVKGSGIYDSAELVKEQYEVLKGKRLWGAFGRFYGLSGGLRELFSQDSRADGECPVCGEAGLLLGAFSVGNVQWSAGGYWAVKDTVFQ